MQNRALDAPGVLKLGRVVHPLSSHGGLLTFTIPGSLCDAQNNRCDRPATLQEAALVQPGWLQSLYLKLALRLAVKLAAAVCSANVSILGVDCASGVTGT